MCPTITQRKYNATRLRYLPMDATEAARAGVGRSVQPRRDPLGLRGCGFFRVKDGKIVFQRGYWDKLTFLSLHGLPLPTR